MRFLSFFWIFGDACTLSGSLPTRPCQATTYFEIPTDAFNADSGQRVKYSCKSIRNPSLALPYLDAEIVKPNRGISVTYSPLNRMTKACSFQYSGL